MRDYYEILGVAKDADSESIKKAYRKLAMQFHPDRNPGNAEAEEKFKEAAAAYDILSNSDKRARYDRFGHQAFQGGGGAGFHDMDDIFSSFGDIFSDLFGAGGQQRTRRKNQPRRGADLRYICEIELKDVIEGADKQVEFETEDPCTVCQGSGAEKGSTPQTCPTCGGAGQVRVSQGFFQMATTCPNCRGEGQIVKDPCKACKGKGRAKQKRKIRITVPPGVDTGTRLRVSGEGEGGTLGGPAGDLFVEIAVRPHAKFERDGDDLYAEVDVDYLQLMLGAQIEVPTVTGEILLEIPRGTDSGEILEVPGQGVPNLRGSRRGSMNYKVNVKFPEKLSKDEELALRQIAEKRGVEVQGKKK